MKNIGAETKQERIARLQLEANRTGSVIMDKVTKCIICPQHDQTEEEFEKEYEEMIFELLYS